MAIDCILIIPLMGVPVRSHVFHERFMVASDYFSHLTFTASTS